MLTSPLGRPQPMNFLPRCTTLEFSTQQRHLMCTRTPQRTALARAAAATAPKDKGRRPLLDLVVSKTKHWVEEQQGRSISSEDALVLLEEQQLLDQAELYCFLNQELRHVQVYTTVGSQKRHHRRGISFLDPRCPESITHPDQQHRAGEHGAQRTTTCAQRISEHGHELQRPKLCCVAIVSNNKAHSQDGGTSMQAVVPEDYKTWALECCEYFPDAGTGSKGYRIAGAADSCREWPVASGQPFAGIDNITPAQRRMPKWVAAVFADHQQLADSRTTPNNALDVPLDLPVEPATAGSCSSLVGGSVSLTPEQQVSIGLNHWALQLYPTTEERQKMHAAVEAVRQELSRVCRTKTYTVVRVAAVGSHAKNTSLRNSYDLDLLIDMDSTNFEADRPDCLDSLCKALCRPSSTGAAAASGWELPLGLLHYARLTHPVLRMRLDIQACWSLQTLAGANGNWRQQLLRHMIQRAQAQQLGEDPPPSVSQLLDALTVPTPSLFSRERANLLTPLLTDCVKHADSYLAKDLPEQQSGSQLTGVGSLITTVIRMLKAWSKFGLVEQLQISQADGFSSGDEKAKRPPGHIWEVFVLHVFQQRLKRLAAAGASTVHPYGAPDVRILNLFLDVLRAASEQLRPAGPKQQTAPVIAVTFLYSQEELELFRDQWGPPGALYTPYIIHPADPSYNCTAHAAFTSWGAVADAAGELHRQLQQLLQRPDYDMHQGTGSSVGSQGSSMGSGSTADVWQQALANTSLGPAVREFEALETV